MLLSTLVTVLTIAALQVWSSAGHHVVRREAAAAPTVSGSTTQRALGVLRRWDRRRAAVWAHGDPQALARLYVRGSAAGARDAAMLAAYRTRGLRVRWMRRQVLEVRVRRSSRCTLVLLVVDRLVGGVVRGPGIRAALPQSRPATRVIALRRSAAGWRVVEVYDS